MTSENNQEQRVQQILWEALKLTGDARKTCLEKACGRDSELRREVESLLEAEGQAGTFLFSQPSESVFTVPLAEKTGDHIGHYKLLEKIGEGGFGVVWMAEQEQPVRRRVALKIIKLGMDTREVVARFEAERQALAMMDHANIARVFDGGATETGRPYFVMELVKGVAITHYCDANKLPTSKRLELFMQVCQAVQHAHQKGVIHRDLKPSNILVTVQNEKPVPKVIDFGVAKAMQSRLTQKTLFTRFHQRIGTPAYMSPEQAGLGSYDVDTRSDIYSLGVLLYELLTGGPPFDTHKLLAAGYDAVMRTIREEEPLKPSTRLSTLSEEELCAVAARRGAEPARLGRLVRGDLDWIVMKALEKDRTRRYESASALAEDLDHFLAEEPVSAAAPGMAYRLRKFARRNRLALLTAVLFLLLVVAGASVSIWQAVRATRFASKAITQERLASGEAARATRLANEADAQRKLAISEAARATQLAAESQKARQRADQEAAIAAAVNEFLNEDLLAHAVPRAEAEEKPEPDLKVRTVLDRASEKIGGRFTNQPLVEASLRATMEHAYHQLGIYDKQEIHARHAAELYTRELGETNVFALRMMEQWGDAERHLGRKSEAVRRLQHACELEQQVFGPAHTNTLSAMLLLGVAYAEADQRDQGRALLKEALAQAESGPAAESRVTGELLLNLAVLLAQDGQFGAAEHINRRHLSFTRKRVGSAHLETLGSLERLATVLMVEKKFPESETLFREALALRDKMGRTKEEDTILSENLGVVLAGQRKLIEAEAVFRETVALRRARGPETAGVVVALTQLADVLADEGRAAEAEPFLREAMDILKRQPAIQDRRSFKACSRLVFILRDQGKQAELESALRDIAALLKQRPASAPGVTDPTLLLAAMLGEQGKLAEAEALLLGNWHATAHAPLEDFEGQLFRSAKPLTAERALQKLAVVIDAVSGKHWEVALLARAAIHGRLGRSKEAAVDLVRCSRGPDAFLSLPLVPLWMDSGDISGYERYRRDLLDQYNRSPAHLTGPLMYTPGKGWEYTNRREGDPATAAEVALALALYPSAETYQKLDSLAERAVERGANHPSLPRFQMVLGLVEYRFRRFESAAEWARRSLAGTNVEPARVAMANAVLAMAMKRLGRGLESMEALQLAQTVVRTNSPPVENGAADLGANWPDWLRAKLLVREAASLENTTDSSRSPEGAANLALNLDYFANRRTGFTNLGTMLPPLEPVAVTQSPPEKLSGELKPLTFSGSQGGPVYFPAGIAAVVNERLILSSEVRKAISPVEEDRLRRQYTNSPALLETKLREMQNAALERLIEDELILAQATEAGRQITKEHLDRYVQEQIQTKYEGDSNVFFQVLKATGLTMEEFREKHRRNDLVSMARQEKVEAIEPPTSAQIEQYYHSHEKEFRVEESVKLSMITVKRNTTNTVESESQRKLAVEIRARLAAGEDFTQLARLYSQDHLADRGGDWGWVERTVLRKELEEAACSLKPCECSDIIETGQAWYIIRVAERRPGFVKGLADVRADIIKRVQAQERSSVINQWLRELRSEAFIRYGDWGGTARQNEQVARIEIRRIGVSTVDDADIRSQLQVKQGEPVSEASLNHDLLSLYQTGNFYKLRVTGESVPGGINLVYYVQEKPVLIEVRCSGNKNISTDELLQNLQSKEGGRADERKAQIDARELQRRYRKAGYPLATVKDSWRIDEDHARARITFAVTEVPEHSADTKHED